jgi:hypothetical protein
MMLNVAASPVLFCFLGRGTETCDADRGETLLLRCAPVDWMSPVLVGNDCLLTMQFSAGQPGCSTAVRNGPCLEKQGQNRVEDSAGFKFDGRIAGNRVVRILIQHHEKPKSAIHHRSYIALS